MEWRISQRLSDDNGGGERTLAAIFVYSIFLSISLSFFLSIPMLLIVSKDTLNIIGIDLLSSST